MIIHGLNQTVTHWAVTPDGYGGYTFASPVHLLGRWQDSQELFRTGAGDDSVSAAVVYLSGDVSEGDYLWLGDTSAADPTDPNLSPPAKQVRRFSKSPDLRNISHIRKAML